LWRSKVSLETLDPEKLALAGLADSWPVVPERRKVTFYCVIKNLLQHSSFLVCEEIELSSIEKQQPNKVHYVGLITVSTSTTAELSTTNCTILPVH